MRTAYRTILVLALAGVPFRPALAQPDRDPLGFVSTRFVSARYGLLTVKSVQEELKLSADQIKKIMDIPQKVKDKHQREVQDLENQLVNEEPAKKFIKLHEMREKIDQDAQKQQEDVLNGEQKKRFKQIQLQLGGAFAFQEEELQKTLNLTNEQKDEIRTIINDHVDKTRAIPPPGRPPSRGQVEENSKKMAALQKESVNKVLAILSDDQREKYKKMIGAPFGYRLDRAAPPGRRPAPGVEKDKEKK
jgi:hypothetical protein